MKTYTTFPPETQIGMTAETYVRNAVEILFDCGTHKKWDRRVARSVGAGYNDKGRRADLTDLSAKGMSHRDS